jgi:hypothetical protein
MQCLAANTLPRAAGRAAGRRGAPPAPRRAARAATVAVRASRQPLLAPR